MSEIIAAGVNSCFPNSGNLTYSIRYLFLQPSSFFFLDDGSRNATFDAVYFFDVCVKKFEDQNRLNFCYSPREVDGTCLQVYWVYDGQQR